MTDQTDRHKAAFTDRYANERELEALPPTRPLPPVIKESSSSTGAAAMDARKSVHAESRR